MKQVFIKRGEAVVEEVPVPDSDAGSVLVRVSHSCISSGTELSGVRNSAQPLWRRAMKHPEEVRKVLGMVATSGLSRTRSVVEGRLSEGAAVGYSAAGVVLESGAEIDDLRPGDRVACAGTGYASHAEIIRVPRNLVVHIPDTLDFSVASTVALGAIALQSVRRAQPTLGETFVVIGLGALGQLAVQLLKANGCRVIGTDLNKDRIDLAMRLGMDAGLDADGNQASKIFRLTRDVGADGVIITASGPTDEIVSNAFKLCRRRGRVILVGDVGLALNRADIYEKELDFLVSTSYGPGRYDPEYETQGLTYPVAYVRWTETRNMQEYLDLADRGAIKVAPLIGGEFPLRDAPAAYQALERKEQTPIFALLTYGSTSDTSASAKRVANPAAATGRTGATRLAVVGPGGFVRAMRLPSLVAMPDLFQLKTIVSRNAPRAAAIARQFAASSASTDYRAMLADAAIDAVLIGTRHDQHAAMALDALRAGKHVFLEKPLALTVAELDAIRVFFDEPGPKPMLVTGFNRRFSPHLRRARALVARRTSPMVITYRMNAGFIAPDHWVHGVEGGGRNLGEACHIYDLFTYLTDARVRSIKVEAVPPASRHRSQVDNFIVNARFDDGSIASLTYTALGHTDFPKERLEIFVDGKVIAMDDFRALTVTGAKGQDLKTRLQEKGHVEELREFAIAIRTGKWSIPLWQQLQATEMALEVQAQFLGSHEHAPSVVDDARVVETV